MTSLSGTSVRPVGQRVTRLGSVWPVAYVPQSGYYSEYWGEARSRLASRVSCGVEIGVGVTVRVAGLTSTVMWPLTWGRRRRPLPLQK